MSRKTIDAILLSASNAYGGLSAAELLKLFAANSASSFASSSSSGPASASTAPLASAGVSVSSTNDPANAIKSILAQAQIDKVQTAQTALIGATAMGATTSETSTIQQLGPNTAIGAINTLLEQAQAEQTQSEQTIEASELPIASATTSFSGQTSGGSVTSYSNETSGYSEYPGQYEQEEWSHISGSFSATSVSLASTSDTTGGSSSVSGSEDTDEFQFSVAVDNQSFSFGFAANGLGQVAPTEGDGFSAGQGSLTDDFVAFVTAADGGSALLEFNVTGLNATQAQQVAADFQEVTSAPESKGTALNAENQYTVNYGSGASIAFTDIIGIPPND